MEMTIPWLIIPKWKLRLCLGGNLEVGEIAHKANADQRKALEQIAMAIGGPAAPKEQMKVRYVPITRKVMGKEHQVTLGAHGEYTSRRGGHGFSFEDYQSDRRRSNSQRVLSGTDIEVCVQ